jgi:hypothetical protein
VSEAVRILEVVTFDFPDDLVQLKRNWLAADAARTGAAQSGDDQAFAEAGAQLQDLTIAMHRHPWMRECETPLQAREALREAARQP